MKHNPLRAHPVGGAGGLEKVADASRPHLRLAAGAVDEVGGVHRHQNIVFRASARWRGRPPRPGVRRDPSVFKGVKALGVQPGGRLGAALKAFVVEPPAVAGGTDPHQFFLSGAAFSASLSFSMARFSMRET
jgi:hypothetical protein